MATATKETVLVTVESAQDTGRSGYWELEVAEYDEPLATKEQKLINVISGLSKGQQVSVQMGVKQNGDFTNRYLNDITVGTFPESSVPAVSAVGPSKRDERQDTQARIEAQWAFGRAVELHVAGGGSLADLSDTDKFAALQVAAESLRTGSRALAEKG